ncbi:MAG: macro domain-containing protein [Myxococcales bacterium]|nr:macro domain-containing protein [Myxococcales bacterium]
MSAPKVILTSIDRKLAEAWQRHCGTFPFVEVHHGSIFDVSVDAVVSPANSFGFMDGGMDRLLTERFGQELQARLQQMIRTHHHGELLVGTAEILETEQEMPAFLISAPTMRVAMPLSHSVNPYLAARAVFLLWKFGVIREGRWAGEAVSKHVKSIAFPGLGTGAGGIPPVVCAKQMRDAITEVLLERGVFPQSVQQARKWHDRMCDKS